MLAVFMQELPHRIGDYAVLVNAGMTPFQVPSQHRFTAVFEVFQNYLELLLLFFRLENFEAHCNRR